MCIRDSTETVWKTRWFLLAGDVAAYLLGFGVVRGVGTDAARFSSAYNFDSAVRVLGLNIAIPLDAINSGGSDGETPEFVVVDSAAAPAESSPETSSPAEETAPAETEAVVYGDNVMDIDFNALIANTGNSRINAVSQYVSSQTPSKKNEYTGMFAGKNLILITAEAFAKQVIDPERTPTLYRMATKGIQFTDYYQPAWGGSTTTGEFSNVIGLVPADVGMCMKQAVYQDLFLTMGHQLQKLDYYSAAYHNHFADFYDRNKTCLLYTSPRPLLPHPTSRCWRTTTPSCPSKIFLTFLLRLTRRETPWLTNSVCVRVSARRFARSAWIR